MSEQSTVYWDLSKADDDSSLAALAANQQHAGKFKISLQTIHQKQEMTSASGTKLAAPHYSVTTRTVRRTSTDTGDGTSITETTEVNRTPQCGVTTDSKSHVPMKTTTRIELVSLKSNQPDLKATLAEAVPILKGNLEQLKATSASEQLQALSLLLALIREAWSVPKIGRALAYGLCDVMREEGGLGVLLENCDNCVTDIQLGSARVLEQSLTVKNRSEVARTGLHVIVRLAKKSRDDLELTKASMGILENLFKHSVETCSSLIRLGGLDSLLYSIRTSDINVLRHCAVALANLAIFGGRDNQTEMVSHKTAEWLFPLAFSNHDSVRYYAMLAVAVLSANKELESAVVNSGTLELVEPFITNHDPVEFARSDEAHIQGQSSEWLRGFVPVLSSSRKEAQCLAAFHFAMEAAIKKEQGKTEVH